MLGSRIVRSVYERISLMLTAARLCTDHRTSLVPYNPRATLESGGRIYIRVEKYPTEWSKGNPSLDYCNGVGKGRVGNWGADR